MKIIIEKTKNEISQTAANLLFGQMIQEPRVNIAITAGSTPVKTYEYLAQLVKNKPYLSNVHYYNFDEIPFKNRESQDGVTMTCLRELYLTPAEIDEAQIHPLTGMNYKAQDKKILADGGLDTIFLGIGLDGHFCGNLPDTTHFHDQTTVVKIDSRPDMPDILKKEMIKAHVSEDNACDYYVTMGPKSVMAARQLILMAIGSDKAKIIKQALTGPVTDTIPASILQVHPNLIVLLDEEAASEL